IIAFGLFMTGLLNLGWLQREFRFHAEIPGGRPVGAYVLGLAFAFGWTPCVGPVLASILATAATTATLTRGALLLLAYSLGLGIPFVLLAIAMARGRLRLGWLRRNARRIEIAGGLVLVAMGIAVLTGGWTILMSQMLAWYAQLGWPPI
ncbi:MAG: cytochrome C biogenesis protein, partial [Actinophytocola sp.]|nr:cytochrome C biogenesis protein [Actinophytocola sp.]